MKQKISPAAWILFILLVTVVLVITYLYWETKFGETKGLLRYFEIAHRVAELVTILVAIYMVQFYFTQSIQNEETRALTDYQKGTEDIQKLFLDAHWYQQLRPLYLEMNPSLASQSSLDSRVSCATDSPIENPEYIVGNIIFRKIEGILDSLGNKINEPGFREWDREWRMWMSSPKLQKIWGMSQHQYSLNMQQYVNQHLINKKQF